MLYEKLLEYSRSDIYPFHMPGHKRNIERIKFINPYQIDITEIEGFDNLHHAEGILKDIQVWTADFYKTQQTYFLINGSTCGILSAISACLQENETILVARNCHKSVYHGVSLRRLKPLYVYPQLDEEYGIQCGLIPEKVEEMLIKHEEIKAVIITSPTYDGVVSDIKKIAKIVHSYNIPLIVDEAHGAHFGLYKESPLSALNCGADIVIHSLHKTLPSLTQTALLHLNSDRVDKNKLERYLSVYQSSSPSYLFLASIEKCISFMKKEKEGTKNLFEEYYKNLTELRSRLKELKYIKIPGKELEGRYGIYKYDEGKIILSVKGTGLSGKEMYRLLLEKYRLQMEMASESYVLAMTSVFDTEEGFERLEQALKEIDETLEKRKAGTKVFKMEEVKENKIILSPSEAENRNFETRKIIDSSGKVAGEYVYLYPPGIPILVPGELIEESIVQTILRYKRNHLSVQGLEDYEAEWIKVLKE